MADQIEDALIREVNDELREEQMHKLWQRYGGYVVGAAILVIAIVAGYQGWKYYDVSTRSTEGERFHAAAKAAEAGQTQEALKAFSALGQEAVSGYGVLAQFQEAALLAQNGNAQEAAQLYVSIARDNASDPGLSGLANVLGAMVEINAGGYDRAALELRLQAIAGNDHPYRYSARELLGLIALEAGDKSAAHALFDQLANDAGAPSALAARARDLAQHLAQSLGG